MDEVINLLIKRCGFDSVRWRGNEDLVRGGIYRILPNDMLSLKLPQDMLEFYQKYDGGHRLFLDNGWKSCPDSAELTIYSEKQMRERKKIMLQTAIKDLSEYCLKEIRRTLADAAFCEMRLRMVFLKLLPVGEIGETYPSIKPESLHYILFCQGCFYVIPANQLFILGLHPLRECLATFRANKDVLYDGSMTGILNKVLDVILKGNETVFDLREKQKAQTPKDSLFYAISGAVVDGMLPESFILPRQVDNNEISWADGALDGIQLYHTIREPLTDDQKELLVLAVDSVGSCLFEQAEAAFRSLTAVRRALNIIDQMTEYLLENMVKLNPAFLHAFARILLLTSDDTECVKIGMVLMEYFDLDEDEKTEIRTLALSDEFTLFAMFPMRIWENGNREIFQAAKKVHGWGRIHALRALEPETEEIRDWILYEGIHNNVLAAYSARVCWNKSDADGRMRRKEELTRKEFTAIGTILSALLDEDPMPGLSAMEDGEQSVQQFLTQAAKFDLTEADQNLIWDILDYYSKEETESMAIQTQCRDLLDSYQGKTI